MRPLAIVAAGAIAAAVPAQAGPRIALNGVSIEGVTNERIENCTVIIDALGNVNIVAKGYAARQSPDPAPKAAPLQATPLASIAGAPASGDARAAAPDALTRRYFLVTEQSQPDGTQFDIAVFINAMWIRELKSSEDQAVLEVTKYLHPGPNRVVLAAAKHLSGERHSHSADVTFKVIIGEGNAGGDRVMIDKTLVETKRTAAEVEDVTEEFTVVAR